MKIRKPSFPKSLELEITNYCNLRCAHCPYRLMTRKKMHMPLDLVKKIVDECAYHKEFQFLYPHLMGEPLLHPRFTEIIEYMHEKGIKVRISTNGMVLPDRKAEAIAQNCDYILFSVDTFNEKIYRKLRVGGNLYKVLDNIKRFIEINDGRIPFAVQLLKVQENEEMSFEEEYLPLIRSLWSYIYWKGLVNWANQLKFEGVPMCKGCTRLFECGQILVNGDMVICCMDYDGKSVVGNVQNKTIGEVWNSEQYDKYRNLFLQGRYNEIPVCSSCCKDVGAT